MPSPTTLNPDAIAAEILAASAARRQITPFSARLPDFDLDLARAVTAALRGQRIARGEHPVGRKIGFTNRNIWAEYGVYSPIWGDMYDTTLAELPAAGGRLALAPLLEPRIEPEIAFGIATTPQAGMDEAALLGCIGWIAHGFEIVQSVFPNWEFQVADTVAAYGLHGAYRIGERHPIPPAERGFWLDALTRFEIALLCNDREVDRGRGSNVLDGPLSALRHLVEALSQDRRNPPLQPGEIVTTGTLTRAFPVAAEETWRTEITGLPIPGIALSFD